MGKRASGGQGGSGRGRGGPPTGGRGRGGRGRGASEQSPQQVVASLLASLPAETRHLVTAQLAMTSAQPSAGVCVCAGPEEPGAVAELPSHVAIAPASDAVKAEADGAIAPASSLKDSAMAAEQPEHRVASAGNCTAIQPGGGGFSFALEVQRQAALASNKSTSSNASLSLAPSTPMDLEDVEEDDSGCDKGMCPICLVVAKQSPKKRLPGRHVNKGPP